MRVYVINKIKKKIKNVSAGARGARAGGKMGQKGERGIISIFCTRGASIINSLSYAAGKKTRERGHILRDPQGGGDTCFPVQLPNTFFIIYLIS